ncbi:flotillin [Jannaschia sp. EhC01]|nr:flotillin [Jannaschia sp. EhC01]
MEFILIIVAAVVGFLVFAGLIIGRLYKRTTRELSLVKTGAGGKKVIMDGGTLVIPLLHEVTPVNMKTLRLEVRRTGEGALITQDRMRVDVGVEFYVSVMATDEGIARAAQTLGDRTFYVDQLREMIEGKLIDGLRAVAAKMTMDNLHENRSDFVQQVQNAISEDLLKNGLSLESVSLTALDQTPFDSLDENNAFNAVGMRKLAEVIAKSKKERAEIAAEADVAVRRAGMEAERQKLSIQQDEEQAAIAQVQEIETMKAAQEMEIALRREDSLRESERARIAREEQVRATEIAREKNIRAAEITKERELEVAEQERQIIIQQKSEEESRARASADLARAEATKATEAVQTARDVAEAERTKQIALIEAAREAEREATKIRLAAAAEKDAAQDRADARREEAQAEADAISIRAEAKKKDMLAEAEGTRAITEAENALSEQIVAMKVDMARIAALPGIMEQMVKPVEKIGEIKIHQVGGLGGMNGGGAGGGQSGDKPVVNQALDSIMGMAVQMPALRKLGDELGLSLENGVEGLADSALNARPKPSATPPAPEAIDPPVQTPPAAQGNGAAE